MSISFQSIKYYFISVNILLTSCVNNILIIPKDQVLLKWNLHKQEINKILNFNSFGSISFMSDKRNFFTHFNWKSTDLNNHKVVFSSLFFNLVLEIDLKSNLVKFINNKNSCYDTKNIDDVIKQFKLSIPTNDIPKWLLGLPGSVSNFALNNNGNLKEINLIKENIKIKILYINYYKSPMLPYNIELYLNDNIHLKIKIHKWKI